MNRRRRLGDWIGWSLILAYGCSGAERRDEAIWEDCTTSVTVATAVVASPDTRVWCDSTFQAISLESYAREGFGAAPVEPIDESTRARWLDALGRASQDPDAWSCRGAVCVGGMPDVSVIADLGPESVREEHASAVWVLSIDSDCAYAIWLVVSDGPIPDLFDMSRNPVPGATGSIHVHVCPSSEVFVDDEFVGLAPMRVAVRPGERHVSLRLRGHRENWTGERTRFVERGRPDGFALFLAFMDSNQRSAECCAAP